MGEGWLPSETPLSGELRSLSPLLLQVCSASTASSLNSWPVMMRSISSCEIYSQGRNRRMMRRKPLLMAPFSTSLIQTDIPHDSLNTHTHTHTHTHTQTRFCQLLFSMLNTIRLRVQTLHPALHWFLHQLRPVDIYCYYYFI